ncbi:MAG: HDOD domain-containing protein [Burkholderiaceae bacterium]
MAWHAYDSGQDCERVLVLPRQQPADDGSLEHWLQQARRISRVVHPHLAPVLEVGAQERWPYVAHDAAHAATFAERPPAVGGEAPADVARWAVQALEGLAYAHDAGFWHGDVQPFLLSQVDNGRVCVLGLGVADASPAARDPAHSIDLRRDRERAAEQDVLAMGLVMHGWLCQRPAFDEADTARAASRLPPHGNESLRLPWALPRPLPDGLRTIANRATDAQPRQRFRTARAGARALVDWLGSAGDQTVDAHTALLERVRTVGVLPTLPGAADRAARLALMERQHTEELAQVVLRDPALCFEMLRIVNGAEVRGTQLAGSGPILTVRRAIALIGLEGVRRVALGLRAWPGPLERAPAEDLKRCIDLAQQAARLAARLRPAGYDAELVSLVAMMQNLGRLVVQYHFADEMRQIRKLMTSSSASATALSESAAAQAVLGADLESMGTAVARWWGMDEPVLQMIRRWPVGVAARTCENDADVIREVASAANEAVDTLSLSLAPRAAAEALERVAMHHARTLGLTPKELRSELLASARAPSGLSGSSTGNRALGTSEVDA